jgi:hypothetical protein
MGAASSILIKDLHYAQQFNKEAQLRNNVASSKQQSGLLPHVFAQVALAIFHSLPIQLKEQPQRGMAHSFNCSRPRVPILEIILPLSSTVPVLYSASLLR